MSDAAPVHVIGASGRSGVALCRSLLADGVPFIPVVRDAARWAATGMPGTPLIADITQRRAMRRALEGARRVVSTAHARFAPQLLAGAPKEARLVLLGSTRKYSQWPDAHGTGVLAGERAFLRSGRPGVMLHPTMIYGAQGEDNVQRLARLVARLPFVPLPAGGTALVQPVHQSDVTRAVRAALDREWTGPEALVVAGPEQVRYRDFVRAVAAAAGLPPPRIIAVPVGLLRLLSPITLLPGLPRVRPAELRRLTEDKVFGIAPLERLLGIRPIPLSEGLAQTFGAPPCPSSTGSPTSTTT